MMVLHSFYKYYKLIGIVRFEVFTAVKMTMLFFWVMKPCRLVGRQGQALLVIITCKTTAK
jgi:hypothetical protein